MSLLTSAATTINMKWRCAFSRGLFTGWFGGTQQSETGPCAFRQRSAACISAKSPKSCATAVIVNLEGPLKPGDGVVFDAGKPEEKEEGGRVYEIEKRKAESGNGQLVELRFGHGDIRFSRVHVGDKLWKTSDPELEQRLRQTLRATRRDFSGPLKSKSTVSPANR